VTQTEAIKQNDMKVRMTFCVITAADSHVALQHHSTYWLHSILLSMELPSDHEGNTVSSPLK